MKKIFGMLLICFVMMVYITPVFAVEGEGSSSTNMEYVVEGSFTWSVPAKITIGPSSNHKGGGDVMITSNNLENGKGIFIRLEQAANYNNGFNLKKTGSNTYYPYVLEIANDLYTDDGTAIDSEPTNVNPISMIRTTSHDIIGTRLVAYFASDSDKPTVAGTYNDTLTFAASVYDAD